MPSSMQKSLSSGGSAISQGDGIVTNPSVLKALKYWINTFPDPVCMLYDNKSQLTDGVIIAIVVSYLCGKTNAVHSVAKSNQTSSANKLNFAIKCVLDRYDIGSRILPIKVNDPAIITKIIDGDSNTALLLTYVIYTLANGSKGSLDTDSIISSNMCFTKGSRNPHGSADSSSSRDPKPILRPISILKTSSSSSNNNKSIQGPFVHDPPTESSKPFAPSASFLRHSDCSLGSLISVATSNPMLIPNETLDISNNLYVPRESRLKIIKWIEKKGLGRSSANRMSVRQQFNHEAKIESVKSVVVLDNEFDNGVILSELISFLINRNGTERGNKNAEKEFIKCNAYGERERPRYFLAGTETAVRSKAQALRNMSLVLSSIKGHFELGFAALTSTADDLLTNDVLKWNILYRLYRTRRGLPSYTVPHTSIFKHFNKKGSSNSISNNNTNRSLSPSHKRSSSVGAMAASRSSSRGRPASPVRSKSVDRSIDRAISSNSGDQIDIRGTIGTYRVHFNERRDAEQERRGRSRFRGSDESNHINANRYDINNFSVPFSVRSKSTSPHLSSTSAHEINDKSSFPRNSGSSSPPPREKFNLSTKFDDPMNNSSSMLNLNSSSFATHRTRTIGEGRRADRDGFYGSTNRYLKYGKREHESWLPPKLDPLEVEKARSVALPDILPVQQSAIRGWLLGLGLSILDGEGGYCNNPPSLHLVPSSTAPPLPLSDDKLRNGELLCDLAITLEPAACRHVRLARLIHRRPKSIPHCTGNLEKALWIFKMRKSPPLPYVYLCQPDEIVACNRNVLWGLLWQLMQVYPPADDMFGSASSAFGLKHIASVLSKGKSGKRYSNVDKVFPENEVVYGGDKKAGKHESDHEYDSSGPESLWFLKLPYNPKQRRALDVSLVSWLEETGVLKVVRCSDALPLPATILELEGSVREGILFCIIAHVYMNAPIKQWNKRPLTYGQCVSNVRKAIKSFVAMPNMSHRYLSHGVDEEIVRGDWDCVLGLLEDLRRCCDDIQPRPLVPSSAVWKAEGVTGPYIGLPYIAQSIHGADRQEERRALPFEQLSSGMRGSGHGDHDDHDVNTRFANAFNSPTPAALSVLMSPDSIEKNLHNNDNPHTTFAADYSDANDGGFDESEATLSDSFDIMPRAENLRRRHVALESIVESFDAFDQDQSVVDSAKEAAAAAAASTAPITNTMDSIKLLKFKKYRDVCYKWLCQLHLVPHAVDESHEYDFLSDFSTGILLCKLLCKLEKLVDSKWIILHPKSSAQRLQNIRKALEIVSEKNKHIPLSALACEDDLLGGNKEAIMGLLLTLKKGYNFG